METVEKGSNEIVYENMKCEDIDEVRKLWENTEGIHLHSNGEESFKSIKIYLLRNPGISKVARNNRNEIVGSVLAGHDGRRGLIHHLVVKSNYQGKGIGKLLLAKAKKSLKKEGIKKVCLFVLNENNNGIEFYKHLNWNKEEIISVFSSVID